MTTPMEKPEQPGEYDCCESACDPCVWDAYYEQMAEWNRQQQELKAAADNDGGDS